MKKFDLCFSNPPYTNGVDLKILDVVKDIVDEIVVVHPVIWLLDNKNINTLFTKSTKNFETTLTSSEIFDPNKIFGTSMLTLCGINHIDNNKILNTPINVNYFGRSFQVNDISDITVFGPEWLTIVKPFYLKMKSIVSKKRDYLIDGKIYKDLTGDIWAHPQRIRNLTNPPPPKNKFYFQCRSMVPYSHPIDSGGNDVFDSLIQRNSPYSRYIVKYSDLEEKNRIKYYFNSINEIENFIDYLKTDFVRFCISIYKLNQQFVNQDLTLVPWLDFTKKWTDYELYSCFDIDKKTIDYIESFLPDYFGIR